MACSCGPWVRLSVRLLLAFGQDHSHQFLVGLVVGEALLALGEIIERGRIFARDVGADHLLVGIDNAQHDLQLHEAHVAIAPVGDGVLLPQHILVDRKVNGLVYEVSHLRGPRLVMVYFLLTVKDDPFPQADGNLGHEFIGNTHDDDVSHERVLQQHVGHPTATRHHALPLGLLHVGVMVEHDERERFAQLRHPVFGEVVEIARIDEMKGLGGVGRQ